MIQAQPQSLPRSQQLPLTGLILITEDSLSVAQILAHHLQQHGAIPAILPRQVLPDPEALAAAVAQLRQHHGSITAIVHLAALDHLPMPPSLSKWREATQLHIKSLFYLLQLCAADLQSLDQPGSRRVLSASCLDGYFGRTAQSVAGLPTGAANAGLLKTLVAEWSSVQAKAVDCDRQSSPAQMAEHLLQELMLPSGNLEVGYPQGERTIFRTVAAPLSSTADSTAWTPTADAVVLATGGARGITAEVVAELAVCGLTLIVTGQSPVPIAESATTLGVTEVSQLRQILVNQALQQQQAVTPMQIERQIQQLLRDRAIRENLERFRQLGARVEYWSADVRDEPAFSHLIEQIYARYGRLDGVIHGAGIIEDKLLADKSIDSFNRVFDTKADSAFILSRHLKPGSLKLLVFFTSVAGRYGNRGQSDYAVANEVVNRLAWQLSHQWADSRIVAINWGPWDTTGMASEEVKRQFRERGIVPIPLEAGRKFFLTELQRGQKDEVEIIAGAGPWQAYETEALQTELQTSSVNTKFVLLPHLPQLQADSTVVLDYTLSVEHDPYLKDHCLNGKPVMPATGALEWMAEFVQASWSEWLVAEVVDLRVLRGIVLDAPTPVRFRARAASHADAESLQVSAEIVDPETQLPFYRSTLILRPLLEAPPIVPLPRLTSTLRLDPQVAYRDYLFHGPHFQLITAIHSSTAQGMDAQVNPSRVADWRPVKPHPASWLFDPGLLDTAPQLAIVWARQQLNTTALPSRMGRVVRYGSDCIHGSLSLALRVTQVSPHSLTYDAFFLDEDDRLRLHLQQIESTCNAALNHLATDP